MAWKDIPRKDRFFIILGILWTVLVTIVLCIIWFGQKK